MSVSGSCSLCSSTNFGARIARGRNTAAVAACLFCIGISGANAASSAPIEIAAVPFLAPAAPVSAGEAEAASATFASRFEYRQTSPLRDTLRRSMNDASLLQRQMASLPRGQAIVKAGPAIVGVASTYNPNDPKDSDSLETASGEMYDANDWTAAIRTDLRAKFGGVGFGKNYRPAFALVKTSDKQAIVRINDVGRLKPGRIIDLNERAMRYFDPTMQAGLIDNVSVTPLAGQDIVLGPVLDPQPVTFASRFDGAFR